MSAPVEPGALRSGELAVPAAPGLPTGLIIPAAELTERFSRSSGPGGQSVNTTDSRVELRYDVARSVVLTDQQRQRLLAALAGRLIDGALVVAASEHRSQLRNRAAARHRLAQILGEAMTPPPPARRPRRPSASARQRRLDSKKRRSLVKAGRRQHEDS